MRAAEIILNGLTIYSIRWKMLTVKTRMFLLQVKHHKENCKWECITCSGHSHNKYLQIEFAAEVINCVFSNLLNNIK